MHTAKAICSLSLDRTQTTRLRFPPRFKLSYVRAGRDMSAALMPRMVLTVNS